MSKTTVATCLFVAPLFLLVRALSALAEPEGDDQRAFASAAADLRAVWRMTKPSENPLPTSAIAEARDALRKYDRNRSRYGRALADCLAARVMLLADEKEAAQKRLASSITISTVPENIIALIELSGLRKDVRTHVLCRRCLAELFPGSEWRRETDRRRFTGIDGLPRFPALNRKVMEVPGLLEDAGLDDLAWRTYVETAYMYPPPWVRERLEDTWLSPPVAKYWAKAAECAYRAGKGQLAWDYLVKAAVFGDEKLQEQAQATADRWIANPNTQPGAARRIDPTVKRDALTKAARLYAEFNQHPRAWALIDANRGAFEDSDKLRKELEGQWVALVKSATHPAVTIELTLYGYQVYPTGDPLGVRIPWAFSDEAMDYVREEIRASQDGGLKR